jgi:hypothetical protein
MNYLTNYFGGGNSAGGLRMPQMGQGMDLYGGQPSMNLGMSPLSMPTYTFADPATGTGLKAPSSFGQMPAAGGGMNMQNALGLLKAFGGMGGQQEQQAPVPQMQMPQLPMGSNQSYEDLMKMYGVRSSGLLG